MPADQPRQYEWFRVHQDLYRLLAAGGPYRWFPALSALADTDNRIFGEIDQIAARLGVSYRTLQPVFARLLADRVVEKRTHHAAVYWLLNPHLFNQTGRASHQKICRRWDNGQPGNARMPVRNKKEPENGRTED